MTTKHLKEFADLYGKGFRPYTGEILPEVYERLECRSPEKAYWIVKWPILYCFGCSNRCTPKSPSGFQVLLPVTENRQRMTPAQLLALGRPLRIKEVAYCLNISDRKAFDLQYSKDTYLVFLKDKPLRCTPESVLEEMNRVE